MFALTRWGLCAVGECVSVNTCVLVLYIKCTVNVLIDTADKRTNIH